MKNKKLSDFSGFVLIALFMVVFNSFLLFVIAKHEFF